MKYTEEFLRGAQSCQIICGETQKKKNMVLQAVMAGAKTIEDAEAKVTFCGKPECGCAENVRALLKIYLPIYDLMFEGGGCHHKHNSHEECGKDTCADCIHSCKDE